MLEQSQEGNKEKHDNIIPIPGLKILYKKIFNPNLWFGESGFASIKFTKEVNNELQ